MASVAEKQTPETKKRDASQQFQSAVAVEAVYIVLALGVLFAGLPALWICLFGPFNIGYPSIPDMILGPFVNADGQVDTRPALLNPYLSTSLLLMVSALAAIGLVYVGRKLEGAEPIRGRRAGAVLLAFVVLVGLYFSLMLANFLAGRGGPVLGYLGGGLLLGGILYLMYLFFSRPEAAKRMARWEEQGWFHTRGFKFNQGVRVRRATLIAFLVMVGCGVYATAEARAFGTESHDNPMNAWWLSFPGTDDQFAILYRAEYLGPLLLFAVLGWFAWRSVNWPQFADFLIATEAELNKVSWTTRKRLFQDTIVVLVTVVLLTTFLFVVDYAWVWILSRPVPGVLLFNPAEQKAKQQTAAEW